VLILVPGHVVTAIHISPVDVGREEVNGEDIPRSGGLLDGTVAEGSLGDTASLELVEEGFLGGDELRLRELVNSLIVVGISLLSSSGCVHNTGGPGVLGDSPVAILLNTDVVDTTDDSEETILSPVGAP